MQQAAKVFGLSCYATTDKKEIELLVAKEAEKKYLEHKQLAKRGTVYKSHFREFSFNSTK